MDKLLIVDDERLEREGMRNFIPWQDYGVEVVGTAKNGVDGLQKIESLGPDIVLVDVKMPVMNGIEMIRQAQKNFPNIAYIVLSGYGEYEFTSQAMELGVRHYLLKPCDETKITDIIQKVCAELAARRSQAEQEAAREASARTLLPHAREQILCDLLQGRAQMNAEATQKLIAELGGGQRPVMLLTLRLEKGFDYLEQFVIGNMMRDLLPQTPPLLTVGLAQDVVLLLDAEAMEPLASSVQRLRKEFLRFETAPMYSAASDQASLNEVALLYAQTQELLLLAGPGDTEQLLCYGHASDLMDRATAIFDYKALRSAADYETILWELCCAFAKMELLELSSATKDRVCRLAWRLMEGDASAPVWTLVELADAIASQRNLPPAQGKAEQRDRQLLQTLYTQLRMPGLSIQMLAREQMFMSEDHLGRLFSHLTGEKFSAFVERRRIELACRLLAFQPELKISRLAELVGYSPDAQYFSKAFRKHTGTTPSQYRPMHTAAI